MESLNPLLFASEADLLALAGAGFLLLAGIALVADRVRTRRKKLERVGFVPWTPIFLACMIIGGGLLALTMPQVIAGWL
jgi:hypothetical protein